MTNNKQTTITNKNKGYKRQKTSTKQKYQLMQNTEY